MVFGAKMLFLRQQMKRHLPNLLTLGNLFCGCCAFLYVLNGELPTAAWFTVACFMFDYADGMLARALKVSSPLGKELDSLADVISFGAVPGALFYWMLKQGMGNPPGVCMPALFGFVLSAFSGLRLGRFNLDTRQTSYFIGLSTPACTVLVMGLALSAFHNRFGYGEMLLNPYVLAPLVVILSFLLNSEIPMFGMKVKLSGVGDNLLLLSFLVAFALGFYFLKEWALVLIICFYIIFSILNKQKIIQA